MQLRKLLQSEEERAVSPVIGVILMVAITVILAAVIGTFVLGLGDQVQSTSPTAQFSYDWNASAGTVNITHDGGDGIDPALLNTTVDGTDVYDSSDFDADTAWDAASTVQAGTTADYNKTTGAWASEEVRVIWTAESGDNSATLANQEAPN